MGSSVATASPKVRRDRSEARGALRLDNAAGMRASAVDSELAPVCGWEYRERHRWQWVPGTSASMS